MEVRSERIGGRMVTVYVSGAKDAQTVYCSSYMEAGRQILDQCAAIGCPPFNLVSLSELNWDEDLSPWPHEPVVSSDDHFTGGARDYAEYLVSEVVPYAEGILGGCDDRVIAGYSMGGLFALYAPHVTDAFGRCVSGSGSVWYPGFGEFVESTPFVRTPRAVYLSLGDRESRVRNQHLKLTEGITRGLSEFYASKGIQSVFELNPGNHFADTALRMARGISWVLGR